MIFIKCESRIQEQLLMTELKYNKKLEVSFIESNLVEGQVNQELIKKVLQSCNSLDDQSRLAVSAALTYAMEHATDADFIKEYGTITSNVLLGH